MPAIHHAEDGAKLTKKPVVDVAVWHAMQGHIIGAIERMDTLHTKLHKLATELGVNTIKSQGYETKEAFA